MKNLMRISRSAVSLLLAVSIAGCSLTGGGEFAPLYSTEIMERDVGAVIVDQWDTIAPHLEGVLSESRGPDGSEIRPEDVIEGLKGEENGDKYLEFTYSAAVRGDADEVLEQAKELLPADVYNELLGKADEVRREFSLYVEENSRELQEEYREDFMRDAQQLISRSVVLLTAAVVYAFIPRFMIWGKISAAAAISVAAGATAVTVMSIWRYYEFGTDTLESFDQWLKDVAKEPKASYALATSVVSMAASMEMSPVATGIILGVFAIYQAVDMLRTMIEVYEL